jgi:hypothetical protein
MPTGTHKRVARGRRAGLAAALTVAALTLATAGALAATPKRGAAPYSFAVVSSVIDVPADEPAAQRLFEAIARERSVAFVVYAGDIKGAKEACRDSLYAQRGAILSATRVPLVFIPGNHDWVTCGTAAGGGYDPVERLDFLRQTLLADTALPDPGALPITRESEVARFRPYRENARWIRDDVVYVALNAPAPNNHFLTAGGRNGEFEDRVIANGFWLDHAAEFAKRREARAMAVIFEGDPQFDRYERAERFAWLRFNRPRARDGFRELKRALVKAAATFRGPILVMHASGEPLANGFLIDRPLHADDGALVGNVTRRVRPAPSGASVGEGQCVAGPADRLQREPAGRAERRAGSACTAGRTAQRRAAAADARDSRVAGARCVVGRAAAAGRRHDAGRRVVAGAAPCFRAGVRPACQLSAGCALTACRRLPLRPRLRRRSRGLPRHARAHARSRPRSLRERP